MLTSLLRKIGLKMYLLRFIWKLLLFYLKIGTLLLGYSTERSVGKVLEGLPLETVYFYALVGSAVLAFY